MRINLHGPRELWTASPFLLVSAATAILINIIISSLMIFMICKLHRFLRYHPIIIDEKGRRHPLSLSSSLQNSRKFQYSLAPSTQSSARFNNQNEREPLSIVNEE